MRNGLFEYSCIVDADFDAYEKAQEEWPDGGNDFVIKSVSFHGITSEAIFKRYHTDGSVEEDPDPFEGYAELMTDVQQMIDSVQNGEEVNIHEYFSGLKDKYAVISCGRDNSYGHPHPATLETLEGIRVLRTDELGTIIIHSDGQTITFGESGNEPAGEAQIEATDEQQHNEAMYIGNRNSMKFHYPDCPGVAKTSPKNRIPLSSREEAIALGYQPCGECKP